MKREHRERDDKERVVNDKDAAKEKDKDRNHRNSSKERDLWKLDVKVEVKQEEK